VGVGAGVGDDVGAAVGVPFGVVVPGARVIAPAFATVPLAGPAAIVAPSRSNVTNASFDRCVGIIPAPPDLDLDLSLERPCLL
jgi:hypothetical protein